MADDDRNDARRPGTRVARDARKYFEETERFARRGTERAKEEDPEPRR